MWLSEPSQHLPLPSLLRAAPRLAVPQQQMRADEHAERLRRELERRQLRSAQDAGQAAGGGGGGGGQDAAAAEALAAQLLAEEEAEAARRGAQAAKAAKAAKKKVGGRVLAGRCPAALWRRPAGRSAWHLL